MELLNEKFAFKSVNNHICFLKGEGGIPIIDIRNKFGAAIISLQGAQVLSWIPEGEEEVIWLSEDAVFKAGKSVRGGIPICWPWFGAHESNADFPAHGFARTTLWEILCTEALEDGATRITFTTAPQEGNEPMWPPETTVQYQVTIGKKLEMELVTHNNGSESIVIGQALHTYFRVADVSKIVLYGLEDTDYLDKLAGFEQKYQRGPVSIEEEVDRIYIDTVRECVINDKTLKRNIIINKVGSHSTVVWNPWQETAEKMGDLGEDGYKSMLCVESCNAADDVVKIKPGKAHHLWVQYQVQKL
jgi:glucose-6-phosphate 1-epimerase